MTQYRIMLDNSYFGDINGTAHELDRAIAMAEKYSKETGRLYVVEKFERVWPPKPERKPGDNAIHATIHPDDTTGWDD
jgi:hypothetical protein